MKLDFKSKIAEIGKQPSPRFYTSEQYDEIKVTMDNLTEDRSLEKENEFPNKEVFTSERRINTA